MVVAQDWSGDQFAVSRNEIAEVGKTQLLPYQDPDHQETGLPLEIVHTHQLTADEFDGVIDTILEYERNVHISMFHSDEVNQEAILFANWAYKLLHEAIVPHRHVIAGSGLSWLMQLPYSIEILCSTAMRGQVVTECSATCINYKDFETKRIRRSFTLQFRPELLGDLRDFGRRPEPSYAELKLNDGIRLFARLLYTGMQE